MARSPIRVGDPAPEFTLHDDAGTTVSLADFHGKRNVVLYFYPKDDTPGCTAEACRFRDLYEAFTDRGGEVIGVSRDGVITHVAFKGKYRLPFRLLADPDGAVHERYGVTKLLGILPGRVTFVIDREGIVRHVFSSQMNPKRHVDEALRTLDALERKHESKGDSRG